MFSSIVHQTKFWSFTRKKFCVVCALNCARILVVHALYCAQFLLHPALFPTQLEHGMGYSTGWQVGSTFTLVRHCASIMKDNTTMVAGVPTDNSPGPRAPATTTHTTTRTATPDNTHYNTHSDSRRAYNNRPHQLRKPNPLTRRPWRQSGVVSNKQIPLESLVTITGNAESNRLMDRRFGSQFDGFVFQWFLNDAQLRKSIFDEPTAFASGRVKATD